MIHAWFINYFSSNLVVLLAFCHWRRVPCRPRSYGLIFLELNVVNKLSFSGPNFTVLRVAKQ